MNPERPKPLFSVHLIEQVRFKLSGIRANSQSEALEIARRADLGGALAAHGLDQIAHSMERSVRKGVVLASVTHHEADPIEAAVEEVSPDGSGGWTNYLWANGGFVPAEGQNPSQTEAASADPDADRVRDALRAALGAIDALQHQVSQMSGMFDDEDGTIEEAMVAADDAKADAWKALGIDATPQRELPIEQPLRSGERS